MKLWPEKTEAAVAVITTLYYNDYTSGYGAKKK